VIPIPPFAHFHPGIILKTTSPLLLGLLLLCLRLPAHAQDTFEEGYVVTPANDTLRGYLEPSLKIFYQIAFKASRSDAQLVRYRPAQLRGFYIQSSGEHFYSRVVEVNHKPTQEHLLENNPVPRFVRDTAFVEVLATGKVSLFRLTDRESKGHFFVQPEGGPPEELLLIKFLAVEGVMSTLPVYRQQLQKLLADCPAVRPQHVAYTEKSLQKLVEKYNACHQPATSYVKERQKVRLRPVVFAGGTLSRMAYLGNDNAGDYQDYAAGVRYPRSLSPLIGIGTDLLPFRPANPFGFTLELLGKGHAYQAQAEQAGKIVAVRLAYTDLRVNYSIRYAAPGRVKPFFRLGFSNGLTLLRENTLRVTRRDFGALLYEGSVIDLRKVDYGGFGGVGVSAGRFATELRYAFVEKPSLQKIASMQIHGWHLLLRYRLF
jgi:hypothetical protein